MNTELPEAVTRYLSAHQARDTDTAIAAFHPDGTVTDDGSTYTGAASIKEWLGRSASEYTFTTTFLSGERLDEARFLVTNRLEGDFPGGLVDLRYRFTLRDGLIEDLTIAP
jgi:hypothetical protein